MNSQKTYTLNVLLKWFGIVSLLLSYLVTSGLVSLLPLSARNRRSLRVRNTSFFSRLALVVLRVHVQSKYRERLRSHHAGQLVISNHVSYIDVLVISSLSPSVFITSVELKNAPLLGLLAKLGGSLFVERRNRSGLKQEIDEIARVLNQGFTVVLFPEGTTSNGDRVQQFKKSLFDSAVSTVADILPLCLRYRRINNKALSVHNRDSVFYYGGISFSKHFPEFLVLKSVDVEVTVLKTIKVNAHTSRKEAAESAHVAISAEYHA